jgi:TPR repeat protein
MKRCLFVLAFFVFAGPVCGQELVVPPKCDLQALAIEAALGDPAAQYNLAVEFHRGEKVPQDLASAAVLWRMATKAGNVGAFNNLGHLTYYGRGIKQDYAEGVRLWRVAAMKGFAESQVHLASAYTDGKFLRKNAIEAYAWASAGKHNAALLSDPEMQKAIGEMAEDALNQATASLTKVQLAAAKQKAALYIRQYPPVEEEF